jgi:hypothetical protein
MMVAWTASSLAAQALMAGSLAQARRLQPGPTSRAPTLARMTSTTSSSTSKWLHLHAATWALLQ